MFDEDGENEDELPIYDHFAYAIFTVGAGVTADQILRLPGISAEERRKLLRARILARSSDPYLRALINEGTKRFRHPLSMQRRKECWDTLAMMGTKGSSSYDAAIYLHKSILEGQLWHWNRITRSESSLAVAAAFEEQALAMGAQYELWNCASGACWLCATFDGEYWKISEGPWPVEDTHPHCLCTRDAYFEVPEGTLVRPEWKRATPYDEPWTTEAAESFLSTWN
jgi:hypothetical protein